jgi:hypothetical protein
MDNTVSVGMNRTGLDMAPKAREKLVAFARQQAGRASNDTAAWSELHEVHALEADRVGTVPVPARLKGMATTMLDTLKGNKPQVLIDKLGERLAYERTGVRLYEAFLLKVASANDGFAPDLEAVAAIRDDERSHFELLGKALQQIGADPTAMTPCADVAGVMASGHLQVLTDPRTTIAQALNSLLAVELADNASWELLVELLQGAGHKDLAQGFTVALQTEQAHLATVKGWLRQAVLEEAT